MPANGIARNQVSKELGDNTQPVRLVSVDGVVVLGKHVLKELPPESVELAETLANQSEELVVGSFLTATLDDHAGQLVFTSSGKVDAHQLVAGFLEATRRHDCQVDGTTKIDKIGVGLVFDVHRLLAIFFARVGVACIFVFFVIFVLAAGSLAQDLGLELPIELFVRFPFGIELEDVGTFLRVQLILQTWRMCDLVFFLHKVKLFLESRIVLVLVLSDLEQDLNHVLHPLVDVRLVQDAPELIVHRQRDL
jgi:hypothetical protein